MEGLELIKCRIQARTVWSARAAQDRRAAGGLNCADYGRRGRGAGRGDKLGGEGEGRRLDAYEMFTRMSDETTIEQDIGC